jgi:hypothetical protein
MYGINSAGQLSTFITCHRQPTRNILRKNHLRGTEQRALEDWKSRGRSLTNKPAMSASSVSGKWRYPPNQRGYTFEAVLVELRVARVLADLPEDVDQSSQDALVDRGQALSSSDDDSHGT